MPTLLRIVLVLLTTGVLYAGVALLAFAEVIGTPDGTRLALGSLAVCGLALPPMLAGMFASYWSWDASARRRLTIALVVLLAIQAAGAVGLVALTVARSGLVVAAVVLIAVAAALDPAAVALGRSARRIELRRHPQPTGDLEEFRARIRLGWRRGAIGAALGLAVGIVASVALLIPLAGHDEVGRALVFIPAGAGLGASFGMVSVVLGLAKRVRDLLGGDYSSGRRIGRAVSGKPEALSDDEQLRASRYAAVAPEWLSLQTTQSVVNSLAVLSIAAGSLAGLGGAIWLAGGFVAALAVLTAVTVYLRVVTLRRVRAYAAAHPYVP